MTGIAAAIAITVGVIIVAVLEGLAIVVSAMLRVVLMVLTGCLKAREIYDAVRWDVIFLVAGLIPLEIVSSWGIDLNQLNI
ncbi:hypothetical protein GLO73106DRAFT_00004530 [Gloeocapsa sp. PCC 73106]|nr:hypothetical protein GLO73106DRAFT_00004530 [Gloeocapsa sp. PCC 73106]